MDLQTHLLCHFPAHRLLQSLTWNTQTGESGDLRLWGRKWTRALTQLTESSQGTVHPWREGRLSGQQAALSIRHQDDHHRRHLEPGHKPLRTPGTKTQTTEDTWTQDTDLVLDTHQAGSTRGSPSMSWGQASSGVLAGRLT